MKHYTCNNISFCLHPLFWYTFLWCTLSQLIVQINKKSKRLDAGKGKINFTFLTFFSRKVHTHKLYRVYCGSRKPTLSHFIMPSRAFSLNPNLWPSFSPIFEVRQVYSGHLLWVIFDIFCPHDLKSLLNTMSWFGRILLFGSIKLSIFSWYNLMHPVSRCVPKGLLSFSVALALGYLRIFLSTV